MRKIGKRLARLEAVTSSGCDGCNTPIDVEAIASRVRQGLKDMSMSAYHRQRAAQLCAEADRREVAEVDLSATGRTGSAVPASHGADLQAGTDAAVGLLCPNCRVLADLARRVRANMATAESARTPGELRRQARAALADAERLECQTESSGSNW